MAGSNYVCSCFQNFAFILSLYVILLHKIFSSKAVSPLAFDLVFNLIILMKEL